jgi:hypothetical protein
MAGWQDKTFFVTSNNKSSNNGLMFKTKKIKKEKKILAHYGFEVFFRCFYGHDVEFVHQHLEDAWCYERWKARSDTNVFDA